MTKRKTALLAASTALLGGLVTSAATTAFAASPATNSQPTYRATAVSDHNIEKDMQVMARHCLKHGAMEKQMTQMMNGAGHKSMMGSTG